MKWLTENNKRTQLFKFGTFSECVHFVNQIHDIAEHMNHHPDILIYNYNKVRVMLFTHSEQKITQKDHDLSEKIDALVLGKF